MNVPQALQIYVSPCAIALSIRVTSLKQFIEWCNSMNIRFQPKTSILAGSIVAKSASVVTKWRHDVTGKLGYFLAHKQG